MKRRKRFVVGAVAAGAIAIGAAAGIATASAGDDTGAALTGADLDRASTAALEHTGGGRVTGTEVADEESYYEVEVTLDSGRTVDVQLDRSFTAVSDKVDNESENGSHDD